MSFCLLFSKHVTGISLKDVTPLITVMDQCLGFKAIDEKSYTTRNGYAQRNTTVRALSVNSGENLGSSSAMFVTIFMFGFLRFACI